MCVVHTKVSYGMKGGSRLEKLMVVRLKQIIEWSTAFSSQAQDAMNEPWTTYIWENPLLQ